MSDWIAVALSSDLLPGLAVPIRLPWGDLALWRGMSGRVAAWEDRCPHRGMRLSHGFVRGDMLSCIYHGWRYDGTGQCRKIPAHPDLVPPDAIRVPGFPCVEAGGIVWVAQTAPDAPPPVSNGLEPLRSIAAHASVAGIAALAGIAASGGTVTLPETFVPITLHLQPTDTGTVIHALIPPADTGARIAASLALEDLRRRAETPEAA